MVTTRLRLLTPLALCIGLSACSTGASLPQSSEPARAVQPQTMRTGKRIASLSIRAAVEPLPLGQTTPFSVVAKDASGKVIRGTYDHAIELQAGGLSLSSSTVENSVQASQLHATWSDNVAGNAAATLVASADGHTATVYVQPATGFTYFDVGSNAYTDTSGFQIVLGPDDKLYYGTIGTCSGNSCTQLGAIGRFDPATGVASEIPLNSEVLGLLFTSDGALWFTGGAGHELYRLPPHTFDSRALQTLMVPAPKQQSTYTPRMLTQDDSGNVWFGDGGGGRVLRIPVKGPYRSSSIRAFVQPKGPHGTPQALPWVNGIDFADGTLYFLDENNGTLDAVEANGRTKAQMLLPQQRAAGSQVSVAPRFLTTSSGSLLLSFLGAPRSATLSQGGIDRFAGRGRMMPLKLPKSPAGALPDTLSIDGNDLYYSDLGLHAVGFVDEASGRSRLIPTIPYSSIQVRESPNGIVAMSDGTAWFTCTNGSSPFQPLCLGHTVYLSGWSLFPGPSFTLGAGKTHAQIVGIMENPSQDSGPFTVRSSNARVCTPSKIVDHNFTITGLQAGACTIEVTDARHRRASLTVTVAGA